MPRTSSRQAKKEEEEDIVDAAPVVDTVVAKRKRVAKSKTTATVTQDYVDVETKSPTSAKKRVVKSKTTMDVGVEMEASSPKKTKKPPSHQILTERDVLPKLWTKANANGSYSTYLQAPAE
jgi:hypothetical protein